MVAITGGRDVGERDRGASPSDRKALPFTSTRGSSISLHNLSLVGSTNSIINPFAGFDGVKAETKVEVTIEQAQKSDGESLKR